MVSVRAELVAGCPVTEMTGELASLMVRRADERGEATLAVSQILDHVVAPLYHHVVFALPVDDDYAEQLVRDTLAMAR